MECNWFFTVFGYACLCIIAVWALVQLIRLVYVSYHVNKAIYPKGVTSTHGKNLSEISRLREEMSQMVRRPYDENYVTRKELRSILDELTVNKKAKKS